MNKDEALRLALRAMEYADACLKKQLTTKTKHEHAQDMLMEAITAIKEALETKDKPVAWGMEKDGVILDVICPAEHDLEEGEYTIPLYTHPKEWVGLTDKEVDECLQGLPTQTIDVYARRIETKIKDKNT